MKVRDIMTLPPHTCRRDTTLAAASRRMKVFGCGTLAVIDGDGRLAGMVTDRDLALAIGDTSREASRVAVDKAMAHHVHTCRPDDSLHQALDRMSRAHVRRLPVVDDHGELKGIISIDDIVLWGVQAGGVRVQELTRALRAICAAHPVLQQPDWPTA